MNMPVFVALMYMLVFQELMCMLLFVALMHKPEFVALTYAVHQPDLGNPVSMEPALLHK